MDPILYDVGRRDCVSCQKVLITVLYLEDRHHAIKDQQCVNWPIANKVKDTPPTPVLLISNWLPRWHSHRSPLRSSHHHQHTQSTFCSQSPFVSDIWPAPAKLWHHQDLAPGSDTTRLICLHFLLFFFFL